MGVRGKFWEILKPCARKEGPDFFRDKRVAVDLSYWIVQHVMAVQLAARNPHLRLTFFRTINLFSKFGVFPVFVVDGSPSPLKSQARMARFFGSSGILVPAPEEGVSVERNQVFQRYVKECVELLELFGMPVLKANGEAEALCAQLNRDGYVDACITSDSDAFLFGAKCVVKCLRKNSKEPFECYNMSDIEAGLGLKRNHLIAICLLVGNDHDLNGIKGIGVDTALRFVQTFSEEDILERLHKIGSGNAVQFQVGSAAIDNFVLSPNKSLPKSKTSDCSFCGHPGSKKEHFGSSCKFCAINISKGCTKKPDGYKCVCSSCDVDREEMKLQKQENWQIKICGKISMEPNFPNSDIIKMYLSNNHGTFDANDGPCISWGTPDTDMLVDFLVFHQLWEPSYIRQRMLPMMSTIYLREMAVKPEKTLLIGQYTFDSIQRVKIRYGQQSFVIRWRKASHKGGNVVLTNPVEETDKPLEEIVEIEEHVDQYDEENVAPIHVVDGGWFLLTDENPELVRGAFPEEVASFLVEKEQREWRRRKGSRLEKSESPKSNGIQPSITEFYRSTKVPFSAEEEEEDVVGSSENQDNEALTGKRKLSTSNLSKSARRRLLFN